MSGLARKWRGWLMLKWLWLAHVYPFYWSHKPLCDRFQHDVARFGHIHLCRSCLFVYAGLLTGFVASVSELAWLETHGVLLFLTLSTITVVLSLPLWYKRWPRPIRDVLRYCMGLVIALCGYLLFSGQLAVGTVGAVVLVAFWRVYLRLRARRRRQACAGCAELGGKGICSGYQFQADCLRDYEQKATQWVLGNGTPWPPSS